MDVIRTTIGNISRSNWIGQHSISHTCNIRRSILLVRIYLRNILPLGSFTYDIQHVHSIFVVHSEMPLSSKELSLIYLIIFILMFIAGPGRFSADNIVIRRCCKFRNKGISADSVFASSKRTNP